MNTLKLDLKARSYNIIVGSDIIGLLGKTLRKLDIGSDAYVITNAAIKNRHGKALNKALKKAGFTVRFKTVPDSEKSKSLKVASEIIEDIICHNKKKRIFIVAFGGGVIGDLAGFVASVYKRGIPYVQVPTTLLAQVDSSIGGKTAVDLSQGKNLVGAFYQPRLVYSDVGLLKTLPSRQIKSALAEIVKYAIIKDPALFNYLGKKHKDILALKTAPLEFIVKRCSHIKAKIVEEDEREEKGIRTILNFGHTIGHAIESAGSFKKYNHGEAVALGMLLASDISKSLSLINKDSGQKIENLIMAMGLPTRIRKITVQKIIKAHYHDKKFIGSKNRFVLLGGIGRALVLEDIPLKVIQEAVKKRVIC
ncbi:MAG: 3-dehydroquinate synthase [Candidatus Omnitrophica bacterium]|nr:3-dehydroquinate synthase [Candidatus Omnitrophota bacterium]